jgi:hypothetical protein
MPKVRRRNLPLALYDHLLERVRERNITGKELTLFIQWLDTQPEVPDGQWFKRFPGMIVCGEGEFVKTFLTETQTPVGTEIR